MKIRTVISIVAVLVGTLVVTASAHATSMVFVKNNNVWLARADGSRQVPVTRDGRPGSSYYSPSIADNGTIVALKDISLHAFRPNGQRIVAPRRWALTSQAVSTQPLNVDISPNGRIVATDVLSFDMYYDPTKQKHQPQIAAHFIHFADFRRGYKRLSVTDGFYGLGNPAWIDSRRVVATRYGRFSFQVLTALFGPRSQRGTGFYEDPEDATAVDAEVTRAGDKWAAMRRPLGANPLNPALATIAIYRTGSPPTSSSLLCTIGPGRKINDIPDPSWSPDGKTLYWWEEGAGIYATPVTSAPGCGLKPRLIIRGAKTPDLSPANAAGR